MSKERLWAGDKQGRGNESGPAGGLLLASAIKKTPKGLLRA